MSTTAPAKPARHQVLYAHHLWRQQRFFAFFLVVVGLAMVGLLTYQGQMGRVGQDVQLAIQKGQIGALGPAIWLLYVPAGLLLAGGFLLYRYRSSLMVLDSGVQLSSMLRTVTVDYESIRSVKSLPLRQHFQDGRSRMIAPIMKQHIDQPAVFIKLRKSDEELAGIKRKLGLFKGRLMDDDTIAIPVNDADAVVWEINSHLPEKVGQNQGGARRRKKRR